MCYSQTISKYLPLSAILVNMPQPKKKATSQLHIAMIMKQLEGLKFPVYFPDTSKLYRLFLFSMVLYNLLNVFAAVLMVMLLFLSGLCSVFSELVQRVVSLLSYFNHFLLLFFVQFVTHPL